ncbi:adenylate/guanylate cyclase domain-containing protein [Polaromonas sp.]|jgi:class 3 adenylate cyclase/tetratricopeptide (TPR) repeat protein|uniref:adenylate/guanylate cyclase domain-containing protein n=1 Tax=Polaromonas sp. TaxID=1869339 RepID=UPI002B58AB70|nr:adenylate/guanylate cyclase domain-containing protein [Polaromonas sp.]HQS32501.1 adenylate/guanylate cyclase domain-containing protein [Polaromonas sp.]HQS91660.1 adenylate/guanylate cyclase domain-containing protein [Polaromonas sp.]
MICAKCGVTAASASRFCGNCGTVLAFEASDGTADPAPRALPAATVNLSRRQMTVLFCDLVGSTALSEQMDPEDLFAALAAYHQMVKRVAIRHGGHVAKVVGDGVDLYFGYPVASEDDAVRAVHAGLNIVQDIATLQVAGKALQVRVGVATGQVTVGMLDTLSIAGSTPNLAARIQAEARPNQVVVAPGTQRIAGAQFVYEDRGLFALKGFSDEVRISAVVDAVAQNSRSAWRGRDGNTALVGRDSELALLSACWQKVSDRRCVGALLSAEAGFGKSRLATALEHSLKDAAHLTVRLQCSPFQTNSVLYPFVQHLVQASGFARNDSALMQIEKLESQLAIAGIAAPQDVALIAALVGLQVGNRYPPIELPPPAQLALTKDALVRYFMDLSHKQAVTATDNTLSRYFVGLSQAQPLLLIVEDLHWADPTSVELLELLLAGGQLSRTLVVMTARPSCVPPFTTAADLTTLSLERLGEPAARQMARNLCAAVALPESDLDAIVQRTDGIPLFIEEMTRMVLDAQRAGFRVGGAAALGVPDTLMDLLMERLDRLGPAKALAQVAAVIGNQFPRELLQASAQMDAASFDAQLASLLDAGLILPSASGADALRFKHALVEKTAYDSILLKSRVTLHARVADALMGEFASHVQGESELVARHLARANRALEAARYLLQAGMQSLGRGAPREAAGHLHEGLEALKDVTASAERSECELGLLSVLGPTTMVLMGPGSAPFGDVQKRAHALCHALPGQPRQFPITYGLCLYHWGRAEFDIANPLASALLQTALDKGDDNEAVMAAGNMNGMIQFHLGNPVAARAHLENSVQRYQPERDAALYPVYLMDFGVFGRFYLALSSFVCGDADAARQHALDAYELAQRLNQPHSLGFSLLANFNIACLRDEPAVAQQFAEQCVDFASQYGFPEFIGMARIVRGWAVARQGQPAEGLQDMEAGIELWKMTGFENWQTWFAVLKADVLLMLERSEAALATVEAQFARMDRNGENQFRSLLMAQKAALRQRRAPHDADAAALFDEAAALAEAQGAVAWTRWINHRRLVVPA